MFFSPRSDRRHRTNPFSPDTGWVGVVSLESPRHGGSINDPLPASLRCSIQSPVTESVTSDAPPTQAREAWVGHPACLSHPSKGSLGGAPALPGLISETFLMTQKPQPIQ